MAAYINVLIHSQLNEYPTEKHYPADIKIVDLKQKLELITGASFKTMTIELTFGDKPTVTLDNDEETLLHYVGDMPSKDSIVKLVVKDDSSLDLLSGDAPKVTISEEKYNSRPNVRTFIKDMKEKQEQTQQS